MHETCSIPDECTVKRYRDKSRIVPGMEKRSDQYNDKGKGGFSSITTRAKVIKSSCWHRGFEAVFHDLSTDEKFRWTGIRMRCERGFAVARLLPGTRTKRHGGRRFIPGISQLQREVFGNNVLTTES